MLLHSWGFLSVVGLLLCIAGNAGQRLIKLELTSNSTLQKDVFLA